MYPLTGCRQRVWIKLRFGTCREHLEWTALTLDHDLRYIGPSEPILSAGRRGILAQVVVDAERLVLLDLWMDDAIDNRDGF